MTAAGLAQERSRSDEAEPERPGKVVEYHLKGSLGLRYLRYTPRCGGLGAPLVVAVHGLSGRPRGYAQHLAPMAERFGAVVVAPHFARPRFRDYQRLGREGHGQRADLALIDLAETVAKQIGACQKRFFLMGYSGGAQFVHRFALAHPERVAAAVASSAGWYTFPDSRWPYPLGIGSARRLPGVSFAPNRFLRVPILVTVGERDTHRDRVLRKTARVDSQQGQTRLERAERWVEAMSHVAEERGMTPTVTLRTLPELGHCFASSMTRGGLGPLAFDHFFRRLSSDEAAADLE